MKISQKDTAILREIAKEKADIANLPVNLQNKQSWTDLNDLKPTKPMVFINEFPMNELSSHEELTLLCEGEFARNIEFNLRFEQFCFKNLPGNMVVTNLIHSPIVYNDSGFGINQTGENIAADDSSDVLSQHFDVQIKCEEDIQKIKAPVITLEQEKTDEYYDFYTSTFSNILDVQKCGAQGRWFTPWDELIRLTGVEEAMMDLILEPEYIEKLVSHFVDMSLVRLEQFNKLGIWSSNNENSRVGSGGYGYTTDLAPADKNRTNAKTSDLWGCGNAQIFSDVSPSMHWDFSLKHELRWLKNFGLNYYGCCEALHNKIDILEKIPNLRKISMSPWSKPETILDRVKGRYVLSCKPNPAVFIGFDENRAKKDIIDILEKTMGCNIELVLKDISTIEYKPENLFKWSKIALETIEEFYQGV